MDDKEIIDCLWERSESVISAIDEKYSKYCRIIAFNIRGNTEDAEEVLNDVYNRVWNAIPPGQPDNLKAFIGRITRNLSLDKFEKERAKKRGGGQIDIILSELEECITDSKNSFDNLADSEAITAALNLFMMGLNIENRRIFLRRYWRAASIEDIATDFNISTGKAKSILFRMRNKLRKHLESEGIHI
jgi:RNA polymerase sigma-70 factor (ECF subfamily)